MMKPSRAFLLILDGWGLGAKISADAIARANTPYFDILWQTYPHSTLTTFGEEVGLPEGQMGNSEVGHLNLGAGRVVYQELARINKAVREGELAENKTLLAALDYAKMGNHAVHFVGLVSDGGVHSHINHLKNLIEIAENRGIEHSFIHAFTDGRDVDPKSGAGFLADLQQFISTKKIKIASLVGRYYAMDRDKRWERVKLAYDLLVFGKSDEKTADFADFLTKSYEKGTTDEFILPVFSSEIDGKIKEKDVVICYNFRTDRLRELTEVLSQKDFPDFEMKKLPLRFVTMTRYEELFQNIDVLFHKDNLQVTLGEFLAKNGKSQVRIAETEKYPHVTFFFNGGRDEPFEGEKRLMIPSPKVATYDLQPEMSALEITTTTMQEIEENTPDFICLNFANTDMVGHTGDFFAAMSAAETVDNCLSKIIPLALKNDYACIILADHGNSDFMINADGSPNTAHTKNPVPCILVSAQVTDNQELMTGKLADVAPTILALMGLPQPPEMTGTSLLSSRL
jgi:2,3-bisphosphoglycerate-independent phosphoglycerate mutase